jgi:hypothetical protein
MSATTAAADPRVEIENATHRFAQATAAYMVRLEGILGSLNCYAPDGLRGSCEPEVALSIRRNCEQVSF